MDHSGRACLTAKNTAHALSTINTTITETAINPILNRPIRIIFLSLNFRYQMAQRRYRMNKKHSRTDIAHHLPYPRSVFAGIAMDFAFPAARLTIAFRTILKPFAGIIEQTGAFFTQTRCRSVMPPTIDPYHHANHFFLLFYTCHRMIIYACFDKGC